MSDDVGFGEFGENEDPELRAMLAALDPMSARVPVESPTSPRARHQLEQIMQNTDPGNEQLAAGIVATTPTTIRPFRSRGKTWLAAAAAVAAIAIGTTVAISANGGNDMENLVAAPTVLALQTSGGDTSMQMCMMFDVQQLRTAGVAFGGTVKSIDSEKVTLVVDRWFKGTPKADEVTIAIPPGGDQVALDGVEFIQGNRYLISATDGVLGTCGYSGPASPEFEKSFEQAFPGA
jgi:hypothetical protein